jgi:hypothetical protein
MYIYIYIYLSVCLSVGLSLYLSNSEEGGGGGGGRVGGPSSSLHVLLVNAHDIPHLRTPTAPPAAQPYLRPCSPDRLHSRSLNNNI